MVAKYSKVDKLELINIPESILDVDFSKVEEPKRRAFFSHFPHDDLPQGARFICVVRDMPDATASLCKFLLGCLDHDINDVPNAWCNGVLFHGSWESHVASVLAQCDTPNVFLVKVEDLNADSAEEMARVASFKELGRVAEFSSRSRANGITSWSLRQGRIHWKHTRMIAKNHEVR